MQFSIQNQLGLHISLHPASIVQARVTASQRPGQRTGTNMPVPQLTVDPALMADLVDGKSVQTSSMTMYAEFHQIAVVVTCGSDAASVVMLDLGDPSVRSWLQAARADGVLPLMLCADGRVEQGQLSLTGGLREAVHQNPPPRACSTQQLHGAFVQTLELLEEVDSLQRLGIDPAVQKRLTLTLIGGRQDEAAPPDQDRKVH